MYLDYFGLSEPPFTITPHTDFFFAGANRGATLEALIYAITHGEGIVKVSGEVGSGKTMLCRVLMERLPKSVETIYLAIPSLKRDEMLQAICADLGVALTSSMPNAQLKALQEHLLRLHEEGKRAVALIDEAHAMPLDSLEEIRLLSNLETNKSKLLQIVLFGQPELDEHLAKSQMRQLRERITHSFRLSPLTLEDVEEYLRHRLGAAGYRGAEVFSPACVKLIARASQGLSRRINIIADKSLLAAYSQGTHCVSPAHVQAAIRDSEFAVVPPGPNRAPWLVGAALVVGLALGIVGTGLVMKRSLPIATASSVSTKTPENESQVTSGTALPLATLPQANLPTRTTLAVMKVPESQSIQITGQSPLPALSERLTHSSVWLAGETGSHWVIQLMLANANETNQLTNFIRDSEQALGAGRIHAYPLTVNGVRKVSVIYGSFEHRGEAIKALSSLPAGIRQFKPYLRSIQLIRSEAESLKKQEVTG